MQELFILRSWNVYGAPWRRCLHILVNLLDEKLVATLLGTALGKAGPGLNHVRWPHRTQYT